MWDLCEIKSKPWLSVTTFCIWLTHILTFCFCVLCLFLKGSFNPATYVWPVVHKPGDRFKRSVHKLGKTAQKMKQVANQTTTWDMSTFQPIFESSLMGQCSMENVSTLNILIQALLLMWEACAPPNMMFSQPWFTALIPCFGVPRTAKIQRPGGVPWWSIGNKLWTGLGWFRVPWGKC